MGGRSAALRKRFRQGDSSKSMFIILDGHVEVFFQDYRARKVQVAVLKDNQFFGEMALLSGDPRNATVRAFEASYLCELQPESLRRLSQQYPSVKQTIQAYYNQRMGELSDKKRKAGFVENRNHLRYNLTLPVMIKPHPPQPTDQRQSGRVFRLLTKDVSLSGLSARLKDANDLAIAKLPVGHPISVTLTLPPPFEAIEVQGVIAHIEFPDSANNRAFGNVGIKFEGMTAEHVEILSSLLQQ
ncbi:MAG: cyclic nucleotide-binding domain-containing protein [Desulfobacterales bacterium]